MVAAPLVLGAAGAAPSPTPFVAAEALPPAFFRAWGRKGGEQAGQPVVLGDTSVKATRPRVWPMAGERGWAPAGRKVVVVVVVL